MPKIYKKVSKELKKKLAGNKAAGPLADFRTKRHQLQLKCGLKL